MPIIVACPKCNGQLRVADNLIGRKVRCPACSATFEALERPAEEPTPAVAPAPQVPDLSLDVPVETQRVDPWRHLNLELTPDAAKLPPPPPAPGLRGAVEVGSSGTAQELEAPVPAEPQRG